MKCNHCGKEVDCQICQERAKKIKARMDKHNKNYSKEKRQQAIKKAWAKRKKNV